MALALWLVVSSRVLPEPLTGSAWLVNGLAAAAVVAFSAMTFQPTLRHAHAGTLLVAVLLIAWAWSSFPRPGPAVAQNQILVGLLLGLLAVVPTEAGRPPVAWRQYVAGRGSQGG